MIVWKTNSLLNTIYPKFALMLKSNPDNKSIHIFWFRRDLRLNDNTGLYHALTSGMEVLPVFIFDTAILNTLYPSDARVSFIQYSLGLLNSELEKFETAIQVLHGDISDVFNLLLEKYTIHTVYTNHDYEPYARERDVMVEQILKAKGVNFVSFKDQVIFEKDEVVKPSGEPYTVFTPYSRKWLQKFMESPSGSHEYNSEAYLNNFVKKHPEQVTGLDGKELLQNPYCFNPFDINKGEFKEYDKTRDYPALDSTSRVSMHLRFGTVSIRQLIEKASATNATWLNEFIWREFFMQILWHFPYVVNEPFRAKYRFINWINDEKNFNAWCNGLTGYPLIDAGMRELNATGFMHNRVRMVTASFLVKHLLISWQWGEAYFASKLLDFELSSNNGNWQWAAGTGCDAAPYFRIFNPITQAERFDPENIYINKWVPEYDTPAYIKPIVDHNYARLRCLEAYKSAIGIHFNNN